MGKLMKYKKKSLQNILVWALTFSMDSLKLRPSLSKLLTTITKFERHAGLNKKEINHGGSKEKEK